MSRPLSVVPLLLLTLLVPGAAAAQASPSPDPRSVVVTPGALPERFQRLFVDGAQQASDDLGIQVVPVDADHNPGDAGAIVVGWDGSGDRIAGEVAGQRLLDAGVRSALCLQVEAGIDSYAARCAGAGSVLGASGAAMSILFALDPDGDPSGIRAAIAGRLTADPGIDAILVTDPKSVPTVIAAVSAANGAAPGAVTIGVFDLDLDTLAGIKAGDIAFAVDQQPWRLGYQAVATLAGAAASPDASATPTVTTPVVVTATDAGALIDAVRAGTR